MIRIALRQTGSLKGLQPEPFAPAGQKQLLVRRLLPVDGWYLARNDDDVIASSDTMESMAMMTETTEPIVAL